MPPEADLPSASFGLLANGASFSCEVLQALLDKDFHPGLLILPEYPPAAQSIDPPRQILTTTPPRRLLEQAEGIETGYAPAANQASCARLVKQHALDFLLVACWPYRIEQPLINSALKATLNMHPSLLPAYRGPNPIEQQLEHNETRFGVTLHLLSQQFDQGDIIAQSQLPGSDLNPDALSLERLSAHLGVELFIAALNDFDRGWKPMRQPVQKPG
jgi:methionyl-tRNA formyltransferase